MRSPQGCATESRFGRLAPARRFRRERSRHLEPSGGRTARLPESPFIHLSTSKVMETRRTGLILSKKFDIAWYYGDYWTHFYLYGSKRNAIDLRPTSRQRSHSRIRMPLPLKERLSATNNGPFRALASFTGFSVPSTKLQQFLSQRQLSSRAEVQDD
jgi:hypothetical protein